MKRKGDIAINYMLILVLAIIALLIVAALYTSFGERMMEIGKNLADKIKFPEVE